MSRGMDFRQADGLFYFRNESKGAGHHAADLRLSFFHMQKAGFHDSARNICYIFQCSSAGQSAAVARSVACPLRKQWSRGSILA